MGTHEPRPPLDIRTDKEKAEDLLWPPARPVLLAGVLYRPDSERLTPSRVMGPIPADELLLRRGRGS